MKYLVEYIVWIIAGVFIAALLYAAFKWANILPG